MTPEERSALIAELMAAIEENPIPEDAVADWDNTNHWEVFADGDPFWFDFDRVAEWRLHSPPQNDPCHHKQARKLGYLIEYGCRYKRDVSALCSEVERLQAENDRLRSVGGGVTSS